jgi:FeS assembly SUF system protein
MNLKQIESKIIQELKQIYDPEIPVNIYDLGLIYKIECKKEKKQANCYIKMTFTTPFCPVSDSILAMVKNIKNKIAEIKNLKVDLVFDPPWDRTKMSDEAKLQLGML